MNEAMVFQALGVWVVAAPALLVAVLGGSRLFERAIKEHWIVRLTQAAVVTGLLAAICVLVMMLAFDTRHVVVDLGNWVEIEADHFHYHFAVKFVFDRLSVPFVILSFVLCGTIGAFAHSYLHRETGFARFFVLYAVFLLGMVVSSLGGTIETLFTGWELVGLSSALLVAFFQDRPLPASNGQRVWSVYRIADAAFLVAAIVLHHMTGEGDFDAVMGSGSWPEGHANLSANQALLVGSLLIIAAAGKSALFPFSGWLPRAMEGPTPSSAIFYGALSVHLGAFMLLRVSPILELSVWLGALVVALGLVTAVIAALAARVQTDIKSALSFASLTQIGIITAEIGLGLRYVALVHILGHACLRTLQFVRAPSLMHDYHHLENAIGDHLAPQPSVVGRIAPAGMRTWWYRFALERGFLDTVLTDYVARPFLNVFRACDRWERRWTDWLSGARSRESDQVRTPSALEELV